MKTIFVKPASIEKKWYVIDAEGQTLGRLAVLAANLLYFSDEDANIVFTLIGKQLAIIFNCSSEYCSAILSKLATYLSVSLPNFLK